MISRRYVPGFQYQYFFLIACCSHEIVHRYPYITMPIIAGETAEFIHHFIVYAQKDCTDERTLTRSMVYGWAPGDEGWALPNDVGFPLFDDVNNQALNLVIHYNNSSLILRT